MAHAVAGDADTPEVPKLSVVSTCKLPEAPGLEFGPGAQPVPPNPSETTAPVTKDVQVAFA